MTGSRDRGAVEALPLAMLTFVVGTLVLAHAWAVVSARNQASAGAHAGARAFVESSVADARPSAIRAAQMALDPERSRALLWDIEVDGRPDRCRPVTVRVSTTVPLLRLPWGRDAGAVSVAAAHTEIVDPFRGGLTGVADCRG